MDLKIFTNEKFGEVRFLELEGKPYAVANDVARALGYEEGSLSTTIKRKCVNLTKCKVENSRGQLRNTVVIPESDIYRLIIGSKLPTAQEFERWVFDEVLVQIRKTGGYIPIQKEMSNEEIMAKALMIAQETINKKDEIIEELTPKAKWFTDWIDSSGTYTSTQMAKLFKISSGKKMNDILHENKISYKQGDSWMPYANVDDEWYKLTVGSTKDGYSYSQLKWTPKGVYEISKLLEMDIKEEDLVNIN